MEPTITSSANIYTYQSFEGSNFTMGNVEVKADLSSNNNVAMGCGVGTNFKNKPFFVLDTKGSNEYAKIGNVTIAQNARIRTKFNDKTFTSQIRYSPAAVSLPVGENTKLYAQPNYAMNVDLQNRKVKHNITAFGGVSHKFNDDLKGFCELDYCGGWNVNAGISVAF